MLQGGNRLHDVLPVSLKAQVTYTLHGHCCSRFPHDLEPSLQHMYGTPPPNKQVRALALAVPRTPSAQTLAAFTPQALAPSPCLCLLPPWRLPKNSPAAAEPGTACTHPACTWPGSPALGPGTTFQTAQPVPFPPPRRSKSFISLGASARGKGRSTWEPLPAPACAGR